MKRYNNNNDNDNTLFIQGNRKNRITQVIVIRALPK